MVWWSSWGFIQTKVEFLCFFQFRNDCLMHRLCGATLGNIHICVIYDIKEINSDQNCWIWLVVTVFLCFGFNIFFSMRLYFFADHIQMPLWYYRSLVSLCLSWLLIGVVKLLRLFKALITYSSQLRDGLIIFE